MTDNSREALAFAGNGNFLSRRAARHGVSISQLLELDRKSAENPEFPLPECIGPEEAVELSIVFEPQFDRDASLVRLSQRHEFVATPEMEALKAHVEACTYCSPLLVAIEPSPHRREEFILKASGRSEVAFERPSNSVEALPGLRLHNAPRNWENYLAVVAVIGVLILLAGFSDIFRGPVASAISACAQHYFVPYLGVALVVGCFSSRALKWLSRWLLDIDLIPKFAQLLTAHRGLKSGAIACIFVAALIASQVAFVEKDFDSHGPVNQAAIKALSSIAGLKSASLANNDDSGPHFVLSALGAPNYELKYSKFPGLSPVPGKILATIDKDGASISWKLGPSVIPQSHFKLGTVQVGSNTRAAFLPWDGDPHWNTWLEPDPDQPHLRTGDLVIAKLRETPEATQSGGLRLAAVYPSREIPPFLFAPSPSMPAVTRAAPPPVAAAPAAASERMP